MRAFARQRAVLPQEPPLQAPPSQAPDHSQPQEASRKIDDPYQKEPYKQVQKAFWSDQYVAKGKTVKLNKMPADTFFKLFCVLVSPTRTYYVITNDMAQDDTDAAEKESSIRRKVEQFYSEDKQITGIESCQCRLPRSQRNHIAMASLV